MRWIRTVVLILHFLIGFYLINLSLEVYPISDVVASYDDLIILIGGALILLGGINFMRTMRRKRH